MHTPQYPYTPACTHTLPAPSLREALLFNHFPSPEGAACGALPAGAGADVRPAEGTARLRPLRSFGPARPRARPHLPGVPAPLPAPFAADLLPTRPGRGLLGSLGVGDRMPAETPRLRGGGLSRPFNS